MKENKCQTCEVGGKLYLENGTAPADGDEWKHTEYCRTHCGSYCPCKCHTAPAQPVEELEHQSARLYNRFILANPRLAVMRYAPKELMEQFVVAVAREKARYCAEVLEKARRHVGDLHIEWVGSRDGDVVEAREAERRWMATALDTMIAEQTKIAEGK